MSYSPTQFADCQTIIKTFERAAGYCPTEESVFAMLSVPLQNIRTAAGAFVEQSELELTMAVPTTARNKASGPQEQSAGVGTNDDKATEDDGGFLQTITDAFTFDDVGDNIIEGIESTVDDIEAANWYKDCIGCDIRPGTLEELMLQAGINGSMDAFLDSFTAMWQQVLAQIESMKQLFDGDPYLDLCTFIKWLKDFVCIPDLARIIAVLMALLSKMAFDFGGTVGIIISLIAPLVQPFLTNLVNSLEKFIFIVLRPIECIINQLQKLLASGGEIFTILTEIEHSSIADNISATQIPVTTRRSGAVTGNALGFDLHEEGSSTSYLDASFGLQERINVKKAENQQRVEDAARNIEALEKAAENINVANPQEVENYNQKRDAARSEYQSAVEARDLSTIQRINKRIDEGRQYVRSIIQEFIKYLREAVRSLESYINQLWDELKKLTLEFGGGHNSFIGDLIKKMGIVQIIQLAKALIENPGLKGCDDEDDVLSSAGISNLLNSLQSGFAVWTDEEGNIHIEDNNSGITDALDAVLESYGSDPNNPVEPGTASDGDNATSATDSGGADGSTSNANSAADTSSRAKTAGQKGSSISSLANSQDLGQTDRGDSVTEARQKLNSLIQLTGDPILDSQIARATEAVVSRTSVTFRCPLQTSVANAEQVNKWISELNE